MFTKSKDFQRFSVAVALMICCSPALAGANLVPGTSSVLCYGELNSPDGKHKSKPVWTWAELSRREYLKLDGYWISDGAQKTSFLIMQNSASTLEEVCRDSFKRTFGEHGSWLSARAGSSCFTPDYDIVFLRDKKTHEILKKIVDRHSKGIKDEFLKLMHSIMVGLGDEQVFSLSLMSYYRQYPEKLKNLGAYVKSAERFEQIEWTTKTIEDRARELILRFGSKSDFEILAYQFQDQGGVKRGALNSYIDLVTDVFKPNQEQIGQSTHGLYNPKDPIHQKLYVLIKAFSIFGCLRTAHEGLARWMSTEVIDEIAFESFLNSYAIYKDHVKLSQNILAELTQLFERDSPFVKEIQKLKTELSNGL
jgi:hypothetical protein